MKKLLIIASAVLVAGIANAASMLWGTGTMFTADTAKNGAFTETKAKASVTAYYFSIDAATYATLYVADSYAASAEKVFATYATKGSDGKTFTVKGDTASNKTAYANSKRDFTDEGPYGIGDTAYAAMILKWTDTATATDYYIANIGSYTFEGNYDGELKTFGTNQFGTGAELTGWTAVPEPTSGLLMLLGMAGLALKRKRA